MLHGFALVLVSFGIGIGSRVIWVSVLGHGVSRNFVVHKLCFALEIGLFKLQITLVVEFTVW